MVKAMEKIQVEELTREKICQYVWARYIDNTKAPFLVDEGDAVHFFEKFYSKFPLNKDEECFYYGILLYELAFSDEKNRSRYLVKSKEVLGLYRSKTGETEWDVVEDRYQDVCDIIEEENLLECLQTVADLAPEIPGMVLVPSGTFPFGPEEKETFLEPYYIDADPVTNQVYREFLEETQYRRPVLWERRPDLAEDDLPVTGVSWMDALQFCKWAKKSLPTSEQWEKAARGPEGWLYPWGNEEPTPDKANYLPTNSTTAPALLPSKSFTQNVSPFGVRSMVGTVWEWTNTSYEEEEGSQLIKGGSYVDPEDPVFLSSKATLWANKKEKSEILGFRCTKGVDGI